VHKRYRQTDDRETTDGRTTIANVNCKRERKREREFTFAKNDTCLTLKMHLRANKKLFYVTGS